MKLLQICRIMSIRRVRLQYNLFLPKHVPISVGVDGSVVVN